MTEFKFDLDAYLARTRDDVQPCGCSLLNRCEEHGLMVEAIYGVWRSGTNETLEILWSLSDGYGEPGYVPDQGYDWSGIRDSSVGAVEAMFMAIHA